MPKRFTDSDKKEWLDLYRGGKTEKSIAKDYAKCDPRTVKIGIEEARQKQDAIVARLELIKDAILKHRDTLLKELDEINSSLYLPTNDYVVIPWSQGGDYILTTDIDITAIASAKVSGGTIQQLLKQHLKGDKLWKVLAEWRKAYSAHLTARLALQRKMVEIIQTTTGCKLVDGNDAPTPFIYSYPTGDLFFRTILQNAFGNNKVIDIEKDIVAIPNNKDVRHLSQVLAQASGNEDNIRFKLVEAYRKSQELSEITPVIDTFTILEEATGKVRGVIEQIKLLGLVPGHCDVCRRLGM